MPQGLEKQSGYGGYSPDKHHQVDLETATIRNERSYSSRSSVADDPAVLHCLTIVMI
jgi:hypothetical protein